MVLSWQAAGSKRCWCRWHAAAACTQWQHLWRRPCAIPALWRPVLVSAPSLDCLRGLCTLSRHSKHSSLNVDRQIQQRKSVLWHKDWAEGWAQAPTGLLPKSQAAGSFGTVSNADPRVLLTEELTAGVQQHLNSIAILSLSCYLAY